ncbi:DUF3152 domain-containing protein [Streptomyces sp. NPDC007851]|uniref:DUF3152 domain-containing protein n=1 Tax=Streptomyces sp. NPDC007851 TaxID=3155008 RepID=UPI0033DFB776
MGRHSRRGPASKDDAAGITGAEPSSDDTAARGMPRTADDTPARGVPRTTDGTPACGMPRTADGNPARGMSRLPEGAPARGSRDLPDGSPAQGGPRFPDGTPARGVSRVPGGVRTDGVPRGPGGGPADGGPRVRGGHPEQREAGGGWGRPGGEQAGVSIPRQRRRPPGGPRKEYVDAFEEDTAVFAPRPRPGIGDRRAETYPPGAGPRTSPLASEPYGDDDDAPPTGVPAQSRGGKGRAFTGIAAAAVTTVLAVIVAGQVADGRDSGARTESAAGDARATDGAASRGDSRTTPSVSASPSVATLSYEQAMDTKYPLSATLAGSGKFAAVPGSAKAPGKGRKYTYRVDVEQGLGLDGKLFADAVQKTLNDDRSWAHDGARTFERVSSGRPDFVITLASPGTTAKWCAKSGLDTTQDNVSCDSASTQRVMINAYRWAQGSKTYGDKMHAYRQMLINHEVGHRLGYGHVTCDKDGELAPVMQQQTKFLDHDGIHCLPNAWPYPKS